MLQVDNLSVTINKTLVDNISFKIDSSQLFALLGESGSGKSLTALSIMRLLPTNAFFSQKSVIKLGSTKLLDLSEQQMRNLRGRKISMIFQDPMTSLNPVMTVGKQLLEVLRFKSKDSRQNVIQLLDRVQIPDATQRINSYPHELSGGMKQRVMIAMALACEPELLIADEPTTALDVTTQSDILKLLREIISQEQMSMLFITHDLALAADNADRIAVMQQGRIIEQSDKTNFFKAARDPYSQKLLHSLPSNLHLTINTAVENKVLRAQGLKVYFPIRSGIFRRVVGNIKAVDGIDFEVRQGETLAIVGESGSGKTTVGKALLNLIPLTEGSFDTYGRKMQVVFQDPYASLDPKLRVIDSLCEGIRKKQRKEKIIDDLLIQVGLPIECKWRFPHEFSGGERQRICIARALSVDPEILICDEPTSSLDVSVQAQVLELLVNLQKQRQLTYIFITHDISLVKLLAHRVAVMYQGKIVEYGDTLQVLERSKHPYTRKLLYAVPKIN